METQVKIIIQRNYKTNISYEGRNQVALMTEAHKKGYTSPYWLTFLQARELNLMVKAGEHGVQIVKFVNEEKDKDGGVLVRGGRKVYTVFNLDQLDELEPLEKIVHSTLALRLNGNIGK